jgi:threonine/homoserine/homoserine lactone efflux protein
VSAVKILKSLSCDVVFMRNFTAYFSRIIFCLSLSVVVYGFFVHLSQPKFFIFFVVVVKTHSNRNDNNKFVVLFVFA